MKNTNVLPFFFKKIIIIFKVLLELTGRSAKVCVCKWMSQMNVTNVPEHYPQIPNFQYEYIDLHV